MDACAYSMTITGVLRRVYGQMRHGTEILARAAKVTPRTAKNWMDGANGPRGAELIRLMQECEELRLEINRIVEEGKCQKGSE